MSRQTAKKGDDVHANKGAGWNQSGTGLWLKLSSQKTLAWISVSRVLMAGRAFYNL
jgi:hypothetical protein